LIKAPRSKGNYDHRNDINIVRVTPGPVEEFDLGVSKKSQVTIVFICSNKYTPENT